LHNKQIKIGDLGLAVQVNNSIAPISLFAGTPIYWSPEMIRLFISFREIVTRKTDIW